MLVLLMHILVYANELIYKVLSWCRLLSSLHPCSSVWSVIVVQSKNICPHCDSFSCVCH